MCADWWRWQQWAAENFLRLGFAEKPSRATYPNSHFFYDGGVLKCDKRYLQVIRDELRAQIEVEESLALGWTPQYTNARIVRDIALPRSTGRPELVWFETLAEAKSDSRSLAAEL